MKYPRLPKRLDRRCKLTEKDILQIRKLRKKGVSVKKIAKRFKISITIIRYWTNEEYRQKHIERANKYPVDIEIKRRRQREGITYRYSLPKYGKLWKKYNSERSKKRYRKMKRLKERTRAG